MVDSLESGYDHDLTVLQFMGDTVCIHSFKSCISVPRRRMHLYLNAFSEIAGTFKN